MPLQPEELLTRALTPADVSKHEAGLGLAAEVLHRFGEVRLVAHGSSMIPSIYPGDLLTVRSESIANARTGEIVLFLLEGRWFVHRVVRQWPEGNRVVFATRGDALTREDPSLDGTQLLGRVTSIVRRGKPVKVATRVSPGLKVLRWSVQNSAMFTKTLLAAHQLRTRLFAAGGQQSAGSRGKRRQECA